MKVAVNCWVLRNRKLDGIGNFTVNTIAGIIKNHPEVEFIILADKGFDAPYFDFKNASIRRIFPPYRHPLLYVFFLELIVPFVLQKIKPDVVLSMDGFLSLSSSYKQIPVFYDLNFEHYPENMTFKNRVYYRYFFKRFAKKAYRIATISEYSKTDIIKQYGISPQKVDNISAGINSKFYVLTAQEKASTMARLSGRSTYFFFVGSIHPRKNVKALLEAFKIFKERSGSNFKLVIAGPFFWDKATVENTLEVNPYKDDIHFIGRISDEELCLALGAAYALTFVPLFEGFGLPIVEAFEAGVPVLASNTTSLPEVAGDAAVYADPFKINSIADGMLVLFENKNDLCKNLVEKGHVQKLKFSWDKTAQLLWKCVEKIDG